MGADCHVRFSCPDWYPSNRGRLENFILCLPSVVQKASPTEIWLKDNAVASSWPYDLRIFLKQETLEIEISAATNALRVDVASLLGWIRMQTGAALVDDDDEEIAT